MVNISPNGIITMNKGDTFDTEIFLNLGTPLFPKQYILKDNDAVYLGVMEPNQSFENAIIRKKYTKDDLDLDNNVKVVFKSSDTSNLIPGLYYYEVKLKYTDNNQEKIDTVIPKTIFNLYD